MTTTTAPTPTAQRAAADLAAIRDQWGDLLAAIDGPRITEWPPRDARDFDRPEPDGPVIGRVPLTLREHPAPLNLDALDTALSVETALFESCDAIAARIQRPVVPGGYRVDHDNNTDPARWHLPTHRSATLVQGSGIAGAGSRAYGLHWAAVWLAGRALDEPAGDLFAPLPGPVLDDLATVAARARHRIETALNRRAVVTPLDRPCPWCAGPLTARTITGQPEQATVTCRRSAADCRAPVVEEHGHRVWRAHTLPQLYAALTAAEEREQA